MINISKKINQISENIESGYCTESEVEKFSKEIADLKSILTWLMNQCSALNGALYDNETKELQFRIKNTTSYHFSSLKFEIATGDNSNVPIIITNWKPRTEKTVTFYHDFNNDYGYKTRKTLQLSIDIHTVEYGMYDEKASRNNEDKNEEQFVSPTDFSKAQSFLTIIRSFYNTVPEYDLRAKARSLEELILSIYDRASLKTELYSKISNYEEMYLPAICKSLDNYIDILNKGTEGSNANDIKHVAVKALDMAVKSSKKLKDNLYSESFVESAVDIMSIEELMKREGLL